MNATCTHIPSEHLKIPFTFWIPKLKEHLNYHPLKKFTRNWFIVWSLLSVTGNHLTLYFQTSKYVHIPPYIYDNMTNLTMNFPNDIWITLLTKFQWTIFPKFKLVNSLFSEKICHSLVFLLCNIEINSEILLAFHFVWIQIQVSIDFSML